MKKYSLLLGLVIVSSLQGMGDEEPPKKNRSNSFLRHVAQLRLNPSTWGKRSNEFQQLPPDNPSSARNSSSEARVTSPTLMALRSPTSATSQSPIKEGVLARFNSIKKISISRALGTKIVQINKVYDPEHPDQVVVVERGPESTIGRTTFSTSREGDTVKVRYSTEDLQRDLKLEIYSTNQHFEVLYEDELAVTSPRRQHLGIGFSKEDDPNSPTK